ncbi:MAG TPA: ABC transporter permease [Tepidisphaeraceae bacterium]|nr:ABC transporter permease [Tepidisphaeraceae bacterium]
MASDDSNPPPPRILSDSPPPTHPSGPKILLRTFLILLGLAIGIAATSGLGLFVWDVSDYDLKHPPHPPPMWPAILFGFLCIAALATTMFLFRRFRRTAKYLLIGLLLGAGFTSLIEGICFLNQ